MNTKIVNIALLFGIVLGIGGMAGSIDGVVDALAKIHKVRYCNESTHVVILSIDAKHIIVLLPGIWRGTDGTYKMHYKSGFRVGDATKIYGDCDAECYSGSEMDRINVFHWDPPKTSRRFACVTAIAGMTAIWFLSTLIGVVSAGFFVSSLLKYLKYIEHEQYIHTSNYNKIADDMFNV